MEKSLLSRIIILSILLLSFVPVQVFCDESNEEIAATAEKSVLEKTVVENTVDENIDYSDKFHIVFDEGAALACVTRIQMQDGRSNFVWNDSLVGAYFTVRLNNLFSFDLLARTEVFYPFKHAFNGMEVFAKQTVLYAFDEVVGIPFRMNKFKYFTLNVVPAMHIMYQLSDEYHLFYFGGAAMLIAEFPVTKRWTILLDGTFTCDYPNLGSNSLVQPFYIEWQWQTSLGVRYSKKMTNKYSFFK